MSTIALCKHKLFLVMAMTSVSEGLGYVLVDVDYTLCD